MGSVISCGDRQDDMAVQACRQELQVHHASEALHQSVLEEPGPEAPANRRHDGRPVVLVPRDVYDTGPPSIQL